MTRRTIVLLAILTIAPAQAETLGRLFHTPEQRALLDQTRRSTPAGVLSPDSSTADTPGVMVNGIVTRSDGKRSTWVNGRMEHGAGDARGSVRMTLPNGEVQLRVGQHIDPATGQVTESYRRVPPPAVTPKTQPVTPATAVPSPKKKAAEARDDDATDDAR